MILKIIELTFFIFVEATKPKRLCNHSTFRLDKSDNLMPENMN